MNRNLLLIAIVGVLGFLAYRALTRPMQMQPATSQTGGGTQLVAQDDVFTQLLKFFQAAANAVSSIAQTDPQTR